jgi:hypothetical protein
MVRQGQRTIDDVVNGTPDDAETAFLTEPLLLQPQETLGSDDKGVTTTIARTSRTASSCTLEAGGDDDGGQEESPEESGSSSSAPSSASAFSVQAELVEMANLAVPLAVSFFCRMGMASTDSAFVGHLHDGHYTAETYLAAAVLSDMVVGVCITPPLAFNQGER